MKWPPRFWARIGGGGVHVSIVRGEGMALTDGDVGAVIASNLGRSPELLNRVPTLQGLVYRARVGEMGVMLKAPDSPDDDGVILEGWAYEHVRQLGVPAPRVLAADVSRRLFPRAYLITEELAGRPVHEWAATTRLLRCPLREAGRYLRLIHSTTLEGYGWLDESAYLRSGRVGGWHRTWREEVRWCLHQGTRYLRGQNMLEGGTEDEIYEVLGRHDSLLAGVGAGSLLHGDFDAAHILVDDAAHVTGFIDFGDRMSGDAAWDLARFGLSGDASGFEDLLEGYEPTQEMKHALSIKLPLYRLIQAVSAARWLHRRGLAEVSMRYLSLARAMLDGLR